MTAAEIRAALLALPQAPEDANTMLLVIAHLSAEAAREQGATRDRFVATAAKIYANAWDAAAVTSGRYGLPASLAPGEP